MSCRAASSSALQSPRADHRPGADRRDEPTGDLDRTTGEEILSLLDRFNRELGKTIIMSRTIRRQRRRRGAPCIWKRGASRRRRGGGNDAVMPLLATVRRGSAFADDGA